MVVTVWYRLHVREMESMDETLGHPTCRCLLIHSSALLVLNLLCEACCVAFHCQARWPCSGQVRVSGPWLCACELSR